MENNLFSDVILDLPQDKQKTSIYAKNYDEKDLGKTTLPSPILTGGSGEINLAKLEPQDAEKFLWMHPVVPRGIEIKANRMVRRSWRITPKNNTRIARKAAQEMETLINNSGGSICIKKIIQDAFGFGGGYRTLVPNKEGSKILTLMPEHPIYFRIAKYPDDYSDRSLRGKMMIDPKTKRPMFYSQYRYDNMKSKWVSYGSLIPASRVMHLVFDTWGDEQEGISVVQYLHLTLKYLMNIEEAGAETMYRNGFIQKKVTTNIQSEKDLKMLAKSLEHINRRDAIILPKDTDVMNLNPGTVQFKEFHDIFLKLLAIRLGIPQPLLTQDGTSTNKATLDSQKENMYDDFAADELIVKQTIEDQVFVPACKLFFGEEFKDFPLFDFNDAPEDASKISEILEVESKALVNFANAASTFNDLGKTVIVDLITDNLTTFLERKIANTKNKTGDSVFTEEQEENSLGPQ